MPTKIDELPIHPDPIASAKAAGLHYTSDTGPGIQRRRAGKGFTYTAHGGETIREKEALQRIKSLAIPPAWTQVWISADPQGHIQATGLDAKGRKQYRYHPQWREVRDVSKYTRMIAFGHALPHIRERINHDLSRQGLPREKVLATVVRLLESTFIRVGNEEYARTNKSFGLTTMRWRHVKVEGSKIRFKFKGKSGKMHDISVEDRRLANVVKRLHQLPGQELFDYLDDAGKKHKVTSDDVNNYLHEMTGESFTAKDFRTWGGTVLATLALQAIGPHETTTQAKRNIVSAVKDVSQKLGNTPAVCRKS
ncbi:MAG: DNA topoisomerase IB, partial [Chloroflexota bacterium]|nr:DNA topoisomerase IB [Chloroflexota bacterium]